MTDEQRRRLEEARLYELPMNGQLRDAIVSAFNLACSMFFYKESEDIDWVYNEDSNAWEIVGSSVPPAVCAAYIMRVEGEA